MKHLLRFGGVVLFLITLLCSCKNENLDIFGSISGKVTDSSTGNPLSAVQVTLVSGGKTIQTTDDGTFSFSELDEGIYKVLAQKEGYKTNYKDVKVVSGEKTETVITLEIINNN